MKAHDFQRLVDLFVSHQFTYRVINMRIHTDHNGVAVNAISSAGGVEGHQYQILAGSGGVDLNFQNGPVQDNGVNIIIK